MKPEPVYKYMSVCPQTVTRDRTLGEARALMTERGFRGDKITTVSEAKLA